MAAAQIRDRLQALARQASYHAEREDRRDAENEESRSEFGIGERLRHGRRQGEDDAQGGTPAPRPRAGAGGGVEKRRKRAAAAHHRPEDHAVEYRRSEQDR